MLSLDTSKHLPSRRVKARPRPIHHLMLTIRSVIMSILSPSCAHHITRCSWLKLWILTCREWLLLLMLWLLSNEWVLACPFVLLMIRDRYSLSGEVHVGWGKLFDWFFAGWSSDLLLAVFELAALRCLRAILFGLISRLDLLRYRYLRRRCKSTTLFRWHRVSCSGDVWLRS